MIVFAVFAAVSLALGFALKPQYSGSPVMFAVVAAPYAVFAAVAIYRMWDEGVLADKLRPKSGDLGFGAFVAMMLFFGAIAGRMLLAPHGSQREGWLIRLYLQFGEPERLQQRFVMLSLTIAFVAALEELVWRGLVFPKLEEKIGTRRAWPATAVLYALAHTPTLWVLRDPFAGLNPLVFVAALGCGLVWGLIVAQTGRLPVAIVSHAFFTWAVVMQFPLWRLG